MSNRSCPTCQSLLPEDAAFCAQCGAATATHVFGETLAAGRRDGALSVSYELEPERLNRALGANFVLGRLIGRGGYAEVFAVRDLKLKRELAIKVLRPDLIVTPSILARFRREAEAVAALAHPNIVPVYDIGEADGICYIVMPLIQGESLKSVLQRQRRLPIDEVRRVVREAANALAAAHRAGVIHRDIKPENIMLEGPERRVRLMDFGISKAMDSGEAQLTGTGVIVGTPQYMSPEQASGDPHIDHRTDQYSLAVVAYQMVSGRAPFDGDTARAIMAKQLLEEPAPLPELVENLPGPVSAALYRALLKDPKKRFDSIAEFAETLAAGSVAEVPSWSSSASGQPVPQPGPGSRWVPWLVAAAAVVVAGVGLTQLRPSTAAPGPPPPAASRAVAPSPALVAPSTAKTTVPSTLNPSPPPAPGDTATVVATPPDQDTTPRTLATPIDCAIAFGNQDWPLAYRLCSAEARANPLAARRAAELAATGRGVVEADERAATSWYLMAPNDATAQLELARRYDQGIGVGKNPTESTKWYRRAAENSVAEAYPIIALRLEIGRGDPKNEPAAARWYEKAAAAGDLPSQLKIASMYALGRVVARSDSAAQKWYEQAALQNNATAQFEVAKLFFRGGRGVRKSESAGMSWLEKAAAGGHGEARRELARRRKS